jgi:carbon storage regulator
MLCLTRKTGQKIHIGGDIAIIVVGIDRDRIRLGIECPRAVPIFRDELLPNLGDSERESLLTDPRDAEIRKLRARVTELEGRLVYQGVDLVPHGPALSELDEFEPVESETYTLDPRDA